MTLPTSDLAGRTALVTGGAGPLGSVLCDALARAGARIIVVDIDDAACLRVVAGLPGGDHIAVPSDLAAIGGVESVIARVEQAGACDILVNNAALTGGSGIDGYAVPLEEQSDEAFLAALRLNLAVPFALSRRLAPLLRRGGHGSIVNVASVYGLVGPNLALYEGTAMGNPAAYAASKGGLVQLTRYLSTVMAPEVRVNAIAPGGIRRGQPDAFVTRYEGLTPLGRMATEDDCRGVVTWLASDAAGYVTGQVIAVDGGWTAW